MDRFHTMLSIESRPVMLFNIFRLTLLASVLMVITLLSLALLFSTKFQALMLLTLVSGAMLLLVLLCLWLLKRQSVELAGGLFMVGTVLASSAISFVVKFEPFIVSATLLMGIVAVLLFNMRLAWIINIFGIMIFGSYKLLARFGGLERLDAVTMQLQDQFIMIRLGFTLVFLTIIWLIFVFMREHLFQIVDENQAQLHIQHDRHEQQALVTTQLQEQYEQQERLIAAIQDLGVPLIRIGDTMRILPLVGSLDMARWSRIHETLLAAISSEQVRLVLIDLTNISSLDADSIQQILNLGAEIRLLGAALMLTGVQAPTARLLAQYDLSKYRIRSFTSIVDALDAIGKE